jgi:hypothetical protein
MIATGGIQRYDNAPSFAGEFRCPVENPEKNMPKKTAVIVMGTVLLLAVGGCSMTSPMEEARANAARRVLSGMLSRYAESVREDDLAGIMELVDPDLNATEKARIRRRLEVSTWLELYTGYQIDSEQTLSPLETETLNQDVLELTVRGSNRRGQHLKDGLMVRRREMKWHIQDLKLQGPQQGAALDLPEEEVKKIRPTLQMLMEAVRHGKAGTVMSVLPDNAAAQKRHVRPGFWGRIFGAQAGTYSVGSDVDRAGQLDFPRWPNIEGDLPMAYLGPATVMSIYDVPYVWPEQGIYNDSLRVEIVFTRSEGDWSPQLLRLYGKAIPGTR